MKKIWRFAAFLCMVLMILLPVASPVTACAAQTDEAQQTETSEGDTDLVTDNFRVRVVPGLEGYYKAGTSVPLMIYLESLNEDFEGIVRVIVPGTYSSQAAAYEKDVMLTAGSEKAISMSVENPSGMYLLKMELEDSSGHVVLEYDIEAKKQANESALVGILSDDFTALNYFDGKYMDFNSYATTTKILELNADIFPDQQTGLEVLSYLIINSYDTSVLSEDQRSALKNWVEDGGILIIGTGSDYRQTLSGFQDGFINGTIGAPRSGELKLDGVLEGYFFSESDGIADLSLEEGSTLDGVLSEQELIWMRDYGQGRIIMTAFNLGMEPVSSWSEKNEFAERLLMSASTSYTIQRMENLNYGSSVDVWALANVLDNLHQVVEPNMKLLVILFVIFVIFAGPGLYLILKAVDRREWMWGIVPALAVVFTAGVFLLSRDMRISAPQEASVTAISYDSATNVVSGKVYIGIRVPGASREELNLSGELSDLQLLEDYGSYTWYDNFKDSGEDYDYKIALRGQSEGYLLTIQNQNVFESSYLSANCETEMQQECGLETEIQKSISGIQGTVTNNTNYDLYGVAVVTRDYIVKIGEMKSGESIDFDESDTEYFKAGYMNVFDYDADAEDVRLQEQISRVWDLLNSEYLYTIDSMSAYTFAWIPEWEADYVVQEKVEEANAAMLIRHDLVPYSDYPDAEAISLFQYTMGSPQNWDIDGWMYDSQVEVSFDVSAKICDVYAFVRAEDDASMWGNTGNVTVYGYNMQTQEYDELFTDGMMMEFSEGCPYIDENGIIKMKFIGTPTDDVNYAPEITVIGGGY